VAVVLPVFICELALGYNPGDSAPVWTDVSAYLRSFHITRGRQYELNEMQAGTCDITLKNLDRRFDPTYASSPYYPNVRPMVPVRISATFASTTYRLFTGYVERFPQNRTGPTYAETVVQAVDGFELLTNAVLPGAVYPQELSGTRVTRVLDAAAWSASARSIAAGQSQIPAYTFADTDLVQPLQHLQDVTLSELGTFFISNDGRTTFLDRHSSLGTTSTATFTDQPAVDVTAIGYADIVTSYDKDLIINDWRGQRTGGVVQEALDSASIAKYFQRTQARTPLLTTDAEVLSQMQYLNSQYKEPALRVSEITVTPGNQSAAWTQVLLREIGDRITVREHPPGGGAALVQDSFIQRVDFGVDTHAVRAKVVWGLLPAATAGFWQADVSQVGTDTRAGY
jgi:hypothetical protein